VHFADIADYIIELGGGREKSAVWGNCGVCNKFYFFYAVSFANRKADRIGGGQLEIGIGGGVDIIRTNVVNPADSGQD